MVSTATMRITSVAIHSCARQRITRSRVAGLPAAAEREPDREHANQGDRLDGQAHLVEEDAEQRDVSGERQRLPRSRIIWELPPDEGLCGIGRAGHAYPPCEGQARSLGGASV
jgi:hypothetical protein